MQTLISQEDLMAIATYAAAFDLAAEKYYLDVSSFLNLAQKDIIKNGGRINIGDKAISIPIAKQRPFFDPKVPRIGPNAVR